MAVIPAKAGIQSPAPKVLCPRPLDARVRGHDNVGSSIAFAGPGRPGSEPRRGGRGQRPRLQGGAAPDLVGRGSQGQTILERPGTRREGRGSPGEGSRAPRGSQRNARGSKRNPRGNKIRSRFSPFQGLAPDAKGFPFHSQPLPSPALPRPFVRPIVGRPTAGRARGASATRRLSGPPASLDDAAVVARRRCPKPTPLLVLVLFMSSLL